MFSVERRARHLAAASRDEEQTEEILAEEVARVKDCVRGTEPKGGKQANQRERETCPRGGPIRQSIALERGPHEHRKQCDQEDTDALNRKTNIRIHRLGPRLGRTSQIGKL